MAGIQRSRFRILPGIFLLAITVSLRAQTPSGDEILRRCERNFEGIEDYTAELTATIDMERMRVPQMKVVLYFKRPDKVHLQSESFAMLPKEGFALPVHVLVKNYSAELKGREEVDGIQCYRLELTAKNPGARVSRLTAWVDPGNSTLRKTESTPYRGRTVTVRTTFGHHENRFWLPETMFVTLATTAPDPSAEEFPIMGAQQDTVRRPPRTGTMQIRFANYRVNTGLSDDLFKREPD